MQQTTPNKQQSILVHHFLENSAIAYPDKVAVIHEKTRVTYAGINDRANQLACWLLSRGICQGDRIVILLENSVEYVVAYYGILKAGAVTVPLNTDLKPAGLNPLLAQLEPAAVISSTRFERLLQASNLNVSNLKTLIIHNPESKWSGSFNDVFSFQEIINPTRRHRNKVPAQDQGGAGFQPAGILEYAGDLEGGPNADIGLEAVSVKPSDLASIIYTSGSTGTPKGVMLTHANIVTNVASICEYLQLTDRDIQMVVLPFFYVMGKSLLNTHFAVGGTIVVNNKFAFPATVIKQMVEERVTGFSGVPSTYAYLLHRSPLAKFRDQLGSLRYCSQAGGHMALTLKKKLRQVLPDHTRIVVMYGATEASARLTWLDPERFEEKMKSIGIPIPGTKVRILDKEGRDVRTGLEGELVASGPNIMQGYWRDPEATAQVLDAVGYHTGDIGYKDEEGFIYLSGRRDDMVKVGGHRINPGEIEDTLLATNRIIESAVLGVSDPWLENKLIALVVPQNGDASPEDILERCAEKLPKYKLPSEITFIRSLPKNANGKIDRTKCLELLTRKPPG